MNIEQDKNIPEEIKYQFKIILVGDGGVGKTCLANRFCFNSFKVNTRLTIGLAFNTYSVIAKENGNMVRIGVAIWDFGGQKRFRSLIPQFIAGSHAAILVYDCTSFSSLINLDREWNDILKHNSGELPRILVGAKCDLTNTSTIYEKNAEKEYINKLKAKQHILTSAKTGTNVDKVFVEVLREVVKEMKPELEIVSIVK